MSDAYLPYYAPYYGSGSVPYGIANATAAAGSATLTVTVGSGTGSLAAPQVGDLIYLTVAVDVNQNMSTATVSDSQGQSYTLAGYVNTGTECLAIFGKVNTKTLVAGTDYFTVTFPATTGNKFAVVKGCVGVASATADVTSSANGTSTAPNSGITAAPEQTSELVVGAIANTAAGGVPSSLSLPNTYGAATTLTQTSYLTEFDTIINTGNTQDASGTITSAAWGALVVTFPISLPTITTTSIASVTGTNSGTPISESGGVEPFVYEIISGSIATSGYSMASDGVFTETPGENGSYPFTVQLTDGNGNTAEESYTLVIGSTLTVSPSRLPIVTVGTAYSESFTTVGGTGPYTYLVYAGSLPAGLTLSSGGTVSGTPTSSGVFPFTLQVQDSVGDSVLISYTITVTALTLFLPDNLLIPADSDFEITGNTWVAETSATTVTSTTSEAFTGVRSLEWTSTASGGPTQIHTAAYPCTPESPYIASLWMMPAANADCYIGFEWYNSSGTLLLTSVSDDEVLVGGEWQPLSIAGTSPAGATEVRLFAQVAESSSGDVEYIDLAYMAPSMVQVLIDWINPVYETPSAAGQAFMDVSPFVRYDTGINIQSGRQNAISEIQPGSVTFTLENDSGMFTDVNANSPIIENGGLIVTERRYQVNVADETGNWWTRADGPLSEIDYVGDDIGSTNQASVTGTDVLAYLNRQDELTCWTEEQVLNDGPAYLWVLDDDGTAEGSGVAAETSGNNGPPMRIAALGNTRGTLGITWQDTTGGVETLADAVSPDHPDGSEYWVPGQIQPTSSIRGLDAGVVGAYTVTQGGYNSLGNYVAPSVPLPSITITPSLSSQSNPNQYIGNQAAYLQVKLPNPINPANNPNGYSVEIWYTQDPTVLTDQEDNYGPFIPISLGSSRTQNTIVAGIFLPTSFGGAYYLNPPSWLGRNFTGSVESASWKTTSTIALDTVRRPHHLVINIQNLGADAPEAAVISFYLDGNQMGGSTTIENSVIWDIITVGAAYGGGGSWYGNLSLCSVYNYMLSPSQINQHCSLGQYGMWESTTDDCIAQLAEYASIPPFWNNVSAQHNGLSMTDYQDITGSDPITNMQSYYEDAEQGLLFVARDGSFNYHTRDWRMGYGAPDLLLPPGSFDGDLGLSMIDQFQVNEQAISTNSFTTGVSYVNSESQQEYGTYATNGVGQPITYPLIAWARAFGALGVNGFGLWGDPNLIDACSWAATSRGDPWLTPSAVEIDLLTIEGDSSIGLARSDFFALDIDNMIAPSGTYPQSLASNPSSLEWFIEGINETIQQDKYTMSLYCSPAFYQRAWRPGDSTYGVLGTNTRIGISAPDLSVPQADGKDVSHDAGPPYWTPAFSSEMNNPADNGHGFVGMNDIRGLSVNLQNALTPPIAVVGTASKTQSISSGAQTEPQMFWDTVYADSASGMGIISAWPNWYVCIVPGWYEIDAQLVWSAPESSGGAGAMAWIVVAEEAAQAVASGSGSPITVGQYVCPVGETQRQNTTALNTVSCPTTRMYLGLGDMITLAGEQDSGSGWGSGTDFGGAYMSLRFLGMGTVDDRVQINSALSNGGTVSTPPVTTKSSETFENNNTFSYYGGTVTTKYVPAGPWSLRDTNGFVYQGARPNSSAQTGSQFSQIEYNVTAMRTALSGMTITGAWLTCTNQITWYTQGANLMVGYFVDSPGTATWEPGNNASNVSNIILEGFNEGQTKTFSIPIAIVEALLDDANGLWIGGIGADAPARYGHWQGGPGSWSLKVAWSS